MFDLLLFALTGAFAGLLAGLFGVGGGLIMVPMLAYLLPGLGVPPEVKMHVAIGTSLAVIGLTSLSSARAHWRRGGVSPVTLRALAPGLILGALLGAWGADQLSGSALRLIVGVGALLVAVQMLRPPRVGPVAAAPPRVGELLSAGAVIGAASSLIGIGGGSLSVPYLTLRGLPVHQAVGTAAAAGIPIAWAGAAGFVWTGWGAEGVPGPALGYVSLPAWAGLSVFSVLVAPLGARLAHAASPALLKRAFAVLLAGIGLSLILS